MLSKLSDFIFVKAYAQVSGGDFFDIFDPQKVLIDRDVANPQNTFSTILTTVLIWLLAIVALIAFIYLVLNGVKYITAGGDAGKATEARNGIINAIIGIIVIVLAFFIIQFAVGIGRGIPTGAGVR